MPKAHQFAMRLDKPRFAISRNAEPRLTHHDPRSIVTGWRSRVWPRVIMRLRSEN